MGCAGWNVVDVLILGHLGELCAAEHAMLLISRIAAGGAA